MTNAKEALDVALYGMPKQAVKNKIVTHFLDVGISIIKIIINLIYPNLISSSAAYTPGIH